MKALKITRENKKQLEADYNLEPGYLQLSSGLYLISELGETPSFVGLATRGALNNEYEKTSNVSKTGWIEVHKK